jgi:hypothetical protein
MPASVEFHGFDISLDQVVAKPWLPANIHMHTWDLFEQPPPEFVGYFDVVHVRLITVVIKHNDPRPVLANLTRILSRWLLSLRSLYRVRSVSSISNIMLLFQNLAAIFNGTKSIPSVARSRVSQV